MPSFLFELCDFHLSYLGCPNASSFATTDIVLLVLHLVSVLLFFLFIAIRVIKECAFKGKRIREVLNDMDRVAILAGSANLFRAAMLGNLASTKMDIRLMSDSDAQVHVRTTLLLEHMQLIFAPLGLSIFISTMAKTASGANLFEPIKIGSKVVDPQKFIRLVRVVVLLTNISLVCVFCSIGLQSHADYITWKRAYYLFPSGVSLMVSFPLLLLFGSKVIRALECKELSGSKDESNPSTLQSKKSKVALSAGVLSSNVETPKRVLQKQIRQQKLTILRVSIYGVLAMYLSIAILFICYSFLSENCDHQTLFIVKVGLDSFFWIYCSWYTI
ncbi:hypothetical protein EDD86DRAFT_249205 [Gorgonomyces haynaldii]|nr:hypothetical protein EDD86DRAFT_249205 [Gorgonomyces haynaldii]